MPRPQRKTSSPSFPVIPHKLSDESKAAFLKLLGCGDTDLLHEAVRFQFPGYQLESRGAGNPLVMVPTKNIDPSPPRADVALAIRDVELWLGFYEYASKRENYTPRPANYHQEFKPVFRDAQTLQKRLAAWGQYYRDQFSLKGADIQAIQFQISELIRVSGEVISEMTGKQSAGRSKNGAQCNLVRHLRRIFRDHSRGNSMGRPSRVAFEKLKENEANELKFVQLAVRIVKMHMNDKEMLKLFRDPRCQPPVMGNDERIAEVERIATRLDNARKRKGATGQVTDESFNLDSLPPSESLSALKTGDCPALKRAKRSGAKKVHKVVPILRSS